MSWAALHQRESSRTPVTAFIFFTSLFSTFFFMRCSFATQGLGWFKSHFILSDPSELYFSQANPQYWHLDPMKFFWAPSSCAQWPTAAYFQRSCAIFFGFFDNIQLFLSGKKIKGGDGRRSSASPCMRVSGAKLECRHCGLWQLGFEDRWIYMELQLFNAQKSQTRATTTVWSLACGIFSPPKKK